MARNAFWIDLDFDMTFNDQNNRYPIITAWQCKHSFTA